MKKYNNLYNHLETAYSMSVDELIEKLKIEIPTVVSSFYIEKKNGDSRKIYQVKKDSLTWNVQKFLNNFYFSKIILPECAYGFKKGKSYFDFLEYHVSNGLESSFLKLDIKDFFSSIKVDKLVTRLVPEFENNAEKGKVITDLFVVILSFDGQIPQGFQTSPFLSNYYFFRADLRIQKYCNKLNYKYSRYADDIILSSTDNDKLISSRTIAMIGNIVNDFHLQLNKQKTRISKKELALNGFVISSEIRLSQKKLKELRRVIFIINQCKKQDNIIQKLNSDRNRNEKNKKRDFTKNYLLDYLSGNRSFLISSLKNTNGHSSWYKKAEKLINRIEKSILKVY